MEYWFLSLTILFCGMFFVYFVKDKYKRIVMNSFITCSFATLFCPVEHSLNFGNLYGYDLKRFLFSQKLIGIIDPLTAFFMLLIISIGLLYVLYQSKTSNKPTSTNFGIFLCYFLMFFFALGMQNGLLFFISYSLICLLILVLLKIENTKLAKFKLMLLSSTIIFSAVAIMLLGIFSKSFEFAQMAEFLKLDSNLSSTIFMLVFGGFGLIFILSDILFDDLLLSENKSKKVSIYNIIFCIFCFYSIFRLIGMGAVPVLWCLLLIIASLFTVIIYSLYRVFYSTNNDEILYYENLLQKILSILGLIVGACGYIYEQPLISVLGYSAGVVFFVGFLLNSMFLMKVAEDETSNNELIGDCKAGLLSCCGVPCTIGFVAWVLIISALYFGICSGNNILKLLSISIFILSLLTIGFLVIKLFLVFREHIFKFSFKFSRSLVSKNCVIASLIVLAGVFPQKLLGVVFVPVSMFVGGTKYYELFKTIEAAATCVAIYIWIFIAALFTYVLIKYIKNVFLNFKH